MFSGLRINSPFYILETKDKVKLANGYVTWMSNPYPMFKQYSGSNNMYDQVVDIKVCVDGNEVEFKQLPSNLSIVNFGNDGVIVSDSKESMLNEVTSIRENSKLQLEKMKYYEETYATCDELVRELDPKSAKEYEYDTKISKLEEKVIGIESNITDIKTMLKEALNK